MNGKSLPFFSKFKFGESDLDTEYKRRRVASFSPVDDFIYKSEMSEVSFKQFVQRISAFILYILRFLLNIDEH